MSTLPASLGAVLGILLVFGAAGLAGARALFPPGRKFAAERAGWGFAAALGAVAAGEAACLAARGHPSRWACLAALLLLAACGLLRRVSDRPDLGAGKEAGRLPGRRTVWLSVARVLVAIGVAIYVLRAVTEPMWANDWLAIWGLKGKAIFFAGAYPGWLADPVIAGYSHPEYPFGLPLLYAGVATILGRWDDHAMGLLFPAVQAATLMVLVGWLRRRGISREIAWSAAALLALFEPLYSGFLTGMAEVPLSGALLLLGTALTDALDDTDGGALARLGVASLLATAVKNEGLFLTVVCAALALAAARPRERRARIAAAAVGPALAVVACHRWAFGPVPLRDFDFGLLVPARWGELGSRVAEAFHAEASLAASAWAPVLCVVVLVVLGRRRPFADRLLWLAAAALGVYLILPALAIRGPVWLAGATLPRTAAALVPLAAAAIGARLNGKDGADSSRRNNEGA